MSDTDFINRLTEVVTKVFENEDKFLEYFIEGGNYTCNDDVVPTGGNCYLELEEFYMSGTVCRVEVSSIFSGLGSHYTTHTVLVGTQEALDWLEELES